MNNFEQFINKLKNIKLTKSENLIVRQNLITSISLCPPSQTGRPAVKSPYFLPKIFQFVPVAVLLIILANFSLPGILKNHELQKYSKELEQVALETDNLENDLDIIETEIELDELEKLEQEIDATIL